MPGPNAALQRIAGLMAEGCIVLPNHRANPFIVAAAAHREVAAGHVRGKVMLTATDEPDLKAAAG